MIDDDRTARVATQEDSEAVVEVLVEAFHDDPTWAWAFPESALRAEQHRQLWGALVQGALRYPCLWVTPGVTAAAVWIPPGGTELSAQQEADLAVLIEGLPSVDSRRVRQALECFDEAHPTEVPHYFLTLLGTGSSHRGKGLGLGLLEQSLRTIDQTGMPAYLEASNPGNVALYARYGFATIGSFTLPDGGPEVFTMWREERGTASDRPAG